jgi:hypothetical protein
MTRSLEQKRPRREDEADVQNTMPTVEPLLSDAAKFNAATLRKLKRALEEDPEIDIVTALPSNYSSRLADRKIVKGEH